MVQLFSGHRCVSLFCFRMPFSHPFFSHSAVDGMLAGIRRSLGRIRLGWLDQWQFLDPSGWVRN